MRCVSIEYEKAPRHSALVEFCKGSRDTHTPALVAGLEGGAHDVDVTSAVKGVVETAVGHLDEVILDLLVANLGRVHEIRRAKLVRPRLLSVVRVDGDDATGLGKDRSRDDGQTNTADTKDGDSATGLDLCGLGCGAETGGDTAAEQACLVERCLFGNRDQAVLRDDGVLRESGGAHKVQELLALAGEALGAVGHHTLALRGADGTAQVGLARLAELALLALGSVQEDDLRGEREAEEEMKFNK